jgi:UDP-GlcNAc3NAcA epimerase
LKVPCITLRDETEWIETVNHGWNCLVGADCEKIIETVESYRLPKSHPVLYGDGRAAARMIDYII